MNSNNRRKILVTFYDGRTEEYSNVDYVVPHGDKLVIYIFKRFMPITITDVKTYEYLEK